MIRIMFVCHGNICRSPMAEFIFKKLTHDAGVSELFYVSSSATSTEEIWRGVGNPVYSPAREQLALHGIDCSGKCAVQLTADDACKYDYFVGMDSENIRNMKYILGNKAQGKVFKLMDFTDRKGDVSDPWYTDRFDVAYRDIYEGCKALLDTMLKR